MSPFLSYHEQPRPWQVWPEDASELEENIIRENLQQLWKKLAPRDGETLLDLGCSQGRVLASACEQGLKSTGVAFSPEEAAMSQKNSPAAMVVLGSPLEIPFEPESFDLLTALENSAWLEDPLQGLREISRLLKPGGRAGLLLPNTQYFRSAGGDDVPAPKARTTALLKPEWIHLLQKTGLRVSSAVHLNFCLDTPAAPQPSSGFFRKLVWKWRAAFCVPAFLFITRRD